MIYTSRIPIKDLYFNWLESLIGGEERCANYQKLMRKLYKTQFDYIIPMDGNRADDGIDLRYSFGYENDILQVVIADNIDDRPCTVLEMMVALARRCEVHIMSDPDIGDRTQFWFWEMINNLGLSGMTDRRYKNDICEEILYKFMDHEYEPDGTGGLFRIENTGRDLREMEIWYQLQLYLKMVEYG